MGRCPLIQQTSASHFLRRRFTPGYCSQVRPAPIPSRLFPKRAMGLLLSPIYAWSGKYSHVEDVYTAAFPPQDVLPRSLGSCSLNTESTAGSGSHGEKSYVMAPQFRCEGSLHTFCLPEPQSINHHSIHLAQAMRTSCLMIPPRQGDRNVGCRIWAVYLSRKAWTPR